MIYESHSSFRAYGVQIVIILFFMLMRFRCSFHIKHTVTRYTELKFLHPVGSVGHVVHSGTSRV
jgi:hypothetical protein